MPLHFFYIGYSFSLETHQINAIFIVYLDFGGP